MALHAWGDSGSRLAARGLHGWLLKRWQMWAARCGALLRNSPQQAGRLPYRHKHGNEQGPKRIYYGADTLPALAGRQGLPGQQRYYLCASVLQGRQGRDRVKRGEEELGQGDEPWWGGRVGLHILQRPCSNSGRRLSKCTYEEQAEQRQLAVKAAGFVGRLAGCRLRGRGRRRRRRRRRLPVRWLCSFRSDVLHFSRA